MLTEELHDPYAWYTELETKAKENEEGRTKVFKEQLNGITEREIEKQQYISDLLVKAIKSSHDEELEQRDREIEKAKKEAIAKVEIEYEGKGVKSDKVLETDEALLKMIRGIE